MTAKLYNTPRHNLHTVQAGSADNCASGAPSSPPWRRLGHFLATMVLVGFALNEIWEMSQMSAYVETAGHAWTSTLGLCTAAAVSDVGITVVIYSAGALDADDLGWGLRGRWNIYATAAKPFW